MVSREYAGDLVGDLAGLLFHKDRRAAAERYNTIFAEPAFDLDWWDAAKDPGKRAYERYLQLLPRISACDIATDLRELVALHEQATVVDTHLGALLTVQINLVLGTLLEATSNSEVEAAKQELLEGSAVGAYILTELGHGSDLPGLETTATFDPADGGSFVIHTPTATAIKYMPTTAAPPVPGVARFGIVFARLIVDGVKQGNYPFLVRLVDRDGTIRPGITIRPMPEKPAIGMDNSLTRFDHVRVGREALVSHTGTTIDDDGRLNAPISRDNQVWRAIARVRLGRLCISAMAAAISRAALSVALQHATQRDIPSMDGGRIALADLRAHNARLLEVAADTYVASAAVELAIDAFENAGDDEHANEITDLVSLTKYLTTTTALGVTSEVRDRLGAQGMFAHNRIVEFRALRDAAATAEGDSYVIALQAAYRRMIAWENPAHGRPGASAEVCDTDSPEAWLDWLNARETYLQRRARETYDTTAGSRQERWDRAGNVALEAAAAGTANHAARALADRAQQLPEPARQVAEDLVVLFAVRQAIAHSGALLFDGPLPKLGRSLIEIREELLARLAPHLGAIVEAFELPPTLVRSGFGTGSETFVTKHSAALNNS
ncbi:acyl-CoA dehydrogenase family protein [Nocardia sp. NPDC127579]|uniref:acyl-CoA dehydrogenase family protein n=1 Tax=Nocardia sp. NPDC127579 TaxID=3345402 RepID=UPI0036427DB0